MIVRDLDDLKASGRYAEKAGVWTSSRYLLKDDGVGFTLTQTTVAAGQRQLMEYKHHVEANLVIEGEGEVLLAGSGERFALRPGSLYTLDQHERHTLHAHTDMRLVCVFSPALRGDESHDADGSYPPSD